jgi:hypothetical protein
MDLKLVVGAKPHITKSPPCFWNTFYPSAWRSESVTYSRPKTKETNLLEGKQIFLPMI